MDEAVKTKIEHEISRIDKSFEVVKPLLDLCKLKEPDIGLVREPGWFPHKSCIFRAKALQKCGFYMEVVQKLKFPNNSIIEITAAAHVLHSFYNGVESILELFFKYKNEKLPNDINWHKTLFEMAFGTNLQNMKIFNDAIKRKLYEYLLFRHFIRHAYGSELDWNEMKPLINEIESTWEIVKGDFEKFIENN